MNDPPSPRSTPSSPSSELLARIGRLDAAVAQRGRDVTALLEQNQPGRGA